MRRCLVPFLLLALALPATAAERDRFSLRRGQAVFWQGPYVEASQGSDVWSYQLDVTEPGFRLRIGLDHPQVDDVYRIDIADPEGGRISFSSGEGLYSAEHLVRDPAIGRWRIEVAARDVTDSAFRMRAKLEAVPSSLGSDDGPVLPNLQVLPPHEATFLTPLTNGASGADPTGVDLAGAESCHPEEHVEDRAVRCLRFAFGIRNTGLGPLDLFRSGSAFQDQKLVQRVQRADGTYFDRPAGVARYHKTHGHYHHHDAVALQLFAVTDRATGTLKRAGDRHFKGFAHRDELLRDWDRFYPVWTKSGFGLLAGWADIYEWDRPGNYIDFGTNGDGHYLIRMWADPVTGVLESNERDNVGYTYFKVTGDEVDLIEAGRGSDPWDPCKIVVGFGGQPDPRQRPRPNHCPPDTT
ncbi:MAG: lysyl oxidase family protein [Actinomycetota bacterium]|nr:lysyl oxidase family protein [Actinomycetota bacterium]